MSLNFTALPKEERDQSMGRYMDTFSRLENMMQVATQIMLGIETGTAGPIFATLGTKQLTELMAAAANLALTEEGSQRVKKLCERIGKRNMRRNHIVHGYWTTYLTPKPGGYDGQWIRRYDHVDPALMKLEPIDPKLLGFYNFTVPALDSATGCVEEMVQAVVALIEDIPSLLPPPPSREEMFRNWVSDRQRATVAITLRL